MGHQRGEEYGQVLVSVLTAAEGAGMANMATGLVQRYQSAQVPPPALLYIDGDCCGQIHIRRLFAGWPDLVIRLDIWHFMRRFARGCSTDAHPLYATFLSRMSQCTCRWSSEDLKTLIAGKQQQMKDKLVESLSDLAIDSSITRKELAKQSP